MHFELPGEVYNILNYAKIVLGGCERQLSDAAQSRLAEWRRRRGEMPSPLFLAISRTGAIEACPITVSSVAWTLRRRIAEPQYQVAASIEFFQPGDGSSVTQIFYSLAAIPRLRILR